MAKGIGRINNGMKVFKKAYDSITKGVIEIRDEININKEKIEELNYSNRTLNDELSRARSVLDNLKGFLGE